MRIFIHWMIFFTFSLTTPRLPTLEAQCPQFPGGGRGADNINTASSKKTSEMSRGWNDVPKLAM